MAGEHDTVQPEALCEASSAPAVGNQMTVPEAGLIPLAWTHLTLS